MHFQAERPKSEAAAAAADSPGVLAGEAAAAGAALTPKQREALGAWRKAYACAYEREDAQREREAQREAAQREVARLARLRRFEAAEGGGNGPEDVD